jgi:hypothetical protein
MSSDKPASVGRNSPPVDHQFKPGQSGNPRGRPRGSRNVKTIVQEFARERHKVKEGGRRRSVTTLELLLRLLVGMSLNGDVRASKLLDRLRDQYDPNTEKLGYLVVPEGLPAEDWIRREQIRNEFRRPPPEH